MGFVPSKKISLGGPGNIRKALNVEPLSEYRDLSYEQWCKSWGCRGF